MFHCLVPNNDDGADDGGAEAQRVDGSLEAVVPGGRAGPTEEADRDDDEAVPSACSDGASDPGTLGRGLND